MSVRIHVTYDTIDDFLDDYTSNVSIGGMFIEREEPLPRGTRFKLRFRVPNRDRPVETFGTVQWVVPPGSGMTSGMGIAFDELSPSDRNDVEAWLEDHRASLPA